MTALSQPSRYLVVPRTLCFVLDGEEVLLIKRSQHRRIFPGKVNGVGGHVEANEDVRTAALREIMEETGLAVTDLRLAGLVNVAGTLGQAEPLATGDLPGVLIFVFTGQANSREVIASPEGELRWVPVTDVHELDWVDGNPDLLLWSLEARRTGQPFYDHRGL